MKAKKDVFNPRDFTALDCGKDEGPVFMTAEAKARTCELFARFVRSGFKTSLFTRALYDSLNSMFGFIAHYNLAGFYSVKFGTESAQIETLRHMKAGYHSGGSARHTRADMEAALRRWITENPDILAALESKRADGIEAAERRELARLAKRYYPLLLANAEGISAAAAAEKEFDGGDAISDLIDMSADVKNLFGAVAEEKRRSGESADVRRMNATRAHLDDIAARTCVCTKGEGCPVCRPDRCECGKPRGHA